MVASGVAATQRRCAYDSSHRNRRQFQEIASARQFAFAGLRFRASGRGTEQPALACANAPKGRRFRIGPLLGWLERH
jgi:hypothetical protein